MNNLAKLVIEENKDFLRRDLQDDIIYDCKGILSNHEQRLIFDIDGEDFQVDKFLEILSNKPDEDLEVFVKHLRPYYSWCYDRLNDSIETHKRNKVHFVHNLGCIPYSPSPNVRRNDLELRLKNALKELKTGHYVVLHGMIGCGKTSLAVEVLRNYDLIESFGRVFWLSVGPESNGDPSSLQRDLNNLLPESIAQLSTNPVIAKKRLLNWFHEKKWTNSLIVLNEVMDETVLDHVAVGSKFLVITSDKNIITSNRRSICTFINVKEGFNLSETREFCSKALNNSELPNNIGKYVDQLHECTKGHPFTLSLIVSQFGDFKDDLLRNKERWLNYINIFKEVNRRRSLQGLEMIYKAIDAGIENLDSAYKDYFFKLAVFPEDVNIRPEVLATLWGLEYKYLAEDVMQYFVNKSLAVKKWNEYQNSYMFGLHHLIVDYLEKRLKTEDEEKKLHRNLISEYERICNGIWSKLPSDNYIFYYIGYHLQKAGMNDVFPKIYFNLEFLQEKVRVAGPGDVIWDFKKYRDLISNGGTTSKIYDELFFFIEHYGVWIYEGVDILQASLEMPSDTFVFKKGKEALLKKPFPSHYLRFFNFVNEVVPQTLFLTEEIVDVCFGRNLDEAIVATASNCVEVYNLKTKRRLYRFRGHTHRINCLDISPTSVRCLSASADKTVRIWTLEHYEQSTLTRPSNRQKDYIPLIEIEIETIPEEVLNHSMPVTLSLFGKISELVASLCENGEITAWENGKKKWDRLIAGIKSIDFAHEDNFIFASMSTFIYQLSSKTGNTQVCVPVDFADFISLNMIQSPGLDKIVILTKHTVEITGAFKDQQVDFQKMELPFPRSQFFKLCSISQHVAVANEDGSLVVFNSDDGSIIAYIEPQKKIVNFCVREQAILGGHCNKMVTLCPLDVLRSPLTKLKWTTGFGTVLAKVDGRQHSVEVYEEDKLLKKIELSKSVEKMDILENGEAVVVAGRDGHILFQRISGYEKIIVDSEKIPSQLFLIATEDDASLVVINYYNGKTLVWKEQDNNFIEINYEKLQSKDIIDAFVINDAKHLILIIEETLVIFTLDGECLHSMELDELYCINTKNYVIAVSTSEGLHLIHFGENGNFSVKEIIEEDRHIELMAFSPSGRKLAVIQQDGAGKVYDYNGKYWQKFPANGLLKQPKYLAVSDMGHVCYSGGGLVSIVSPDHVFTTAILDSSVIIPDPTGSNIFAVLDKTGTVRKIKQENVVNFQ